MSTTTESTKSNTKSTEQGVPPFTAFPPFTGAQQAHEALNAWRKLMDDQMARMGSLFEEVGKLNEKALAQTMTAIDETAKLVKETVTYANTLGTEWRKVTMDATRQAAEAVKSKLAA